MDPASFRPVCEHAARSAGESLLAWRSKAAAREKGPKDLVTEADLASQQLIRRMLLEAHPDHGFLGEEQPSEAPLHERREYQWIVDPLDGTTNYVHGLPHYAVSIALEHGGQLLVGTVYDPVTQECFTAVRGQGAYLNGQPLRVSQTASMQQALVAVSFPTVVQRDALEVRQFLEVLPACRAMRRLGCSSLNLAYLAAGRFDAYWAASTKVWDIAAGVLLVQEAGGQVSGLDGGPLDVYQGHFAAAATPELHAELLEMLQRAGRAKS